MSDHIIQVDDNAEKKKAVNLITMRSRGQYRRWKRVHALKAKKEKGLNPKGERGIHERGTTTMSTTRAQQTQEQIAEIFGVWDSDKEKAQRQASHVYKHEIEMIGRGLGLAGFHVTIHPSADGQWAEITGKHNDRMTSMDVRVYPSQRTIVFHMWRGDQKNLKTGFERVISSAPHNYYLVPNLNISHEQSAGLYLAVQATHDHRSQWVLDKAQAHNHMTKLEQALHQGANVFTPESPKERRAREFAQHTPLHDTIQRTMFQKWAEGVYGASADKWTEKQREGEYRDWVQRQGHTYQPPEAMGYKATGTHQTASTPPPHSPLSGGFDVDAEGTLHMHKGSYTGSSSGAAGVSGHPHTQPVDPSVQPGQAEVPPLSFAAPKGKMSNTPPRGFGGNIHGTSQYDYSGYQYGATPGYQDTRRRETASAYSEVRPYQSSFGREGTETLSGRARRVFHPSRPFTAPSTTITPQQTTHVPGEADPDFVFKGPEDTSRRIPDEERAHRTIDVPWGESHPAVQRVAHNLTGFGDVKIIDKTQTNQKAVFITAHGGTIVLKLTLAGRNNKGQREGIVHFVNANLEPSALQYFFSIIEHLVLLDGGGKRASGSNRYPIHWVNNFTSLVDQVKKGAPHELGHLAAVLAKVPKNNKLTGGINRAVRSFQGTSGAGGRN